MFNLRSDITNLLIFTRMKRSVACVVLACYFLAGSVIFPLSDFSLMQDLPAMYRAYCEVRTGEPDVIDFVGDYLLHGKELFGNNADDLQPKNPGALQFQHQPTLSLFFINHVITMFTDIGQHVQPPSVYRLLSFTRGYRNEHFRPPIA